MNRRTTAGEHERCWLVERRGDGAIGGGPAPLPDTATGEAGDAVVRVEAAGFNYKDALACAGHPGVARTLPLVPGIDAAGTLVAASGGLPAGAAVVVTGNGLGESRSGGFATLVAAPATAIVPRPEALPPQAAMALGTAGLTVLLALDRLDHVVDARRADAEWLVTGASGGVGMLAVAALAKRGRRVVACTRKPGCAAVLGGLGAAEIVPPAALAGEAGKPLLRGRWAGVIDTVGGDLLAAALRAVLPGGAVAAIGMAGGVDLHTTVHPFILRGVTLCGIDAAALPTQDERAALWPRLAALWPLVRDRLPVTSLTLEEVGSWSDALLGGAACGRAVVLPRCRPRHAINLAEAWEPEPSGMVWRRRFGRPTGIGTDGAVRLVFDAPACAEISLNGMPMPALEVGQRWVQDVTARLQDRNELILSWREAASSAGGGEQRRAPLPDDRGRPQLEILAPDADP